MKTLFTLTFTLIISLSAYAKKLPGYYIDLDGNKVEVVFKVKFSILEGEPMYTTIFHGIKYIENDEVKTLRPDMCQKIGFKVNGTKLEFLSLKANYQPASSSNQNSIFVRQKIRGPVSLYYYYYTTTTSGMGYNGAMYMSQRGAMGWVIAKENGQTLKITYGGGKRKDLAEFFSDYEELADKIINKDRSVVASDTEALVKLYNNWRLNQAVEQETKEVSDTVEIKTNNE